jgi:hypothetical protein
MGGDMFEQLKADFPDWHFWRGVGDAGLYAWRPRSSPPKVVRASSADGLRAELAQRAADQHRWDAGH